jgi:hypothetical protein
MLRITYAEHEQLIELAAQSPATASPPQIAESLRRLPGIEGVEVQVAGRQATIAGHRQRLMWPTPSRRGRCRKPSMVDSVVKRAA